MTDKKIDITSTAIEKGLDIAKDFLDKLIIPTVEETGLLLKDKVTMWRFKNQVKMLHRAEQHCKKNNIDPKKISLKQICPLLDYAALEEDEVLQDKWALLLSNMVDSDQNIENHVFPYILSQISKNEFLILETAVEINIERVRKLNIELEEEKRKNEPTQKEIKERIESIDKQIIQLKDKKESHWDLQRDKWKIEEELRKVSKREDELKKNLREPDYLTYGDLKEFEMANLQRLGLIKVTEKNYAYVESHRIKNEPDSDYLHLEDAIVRIEPDYVEITITELGKLFILACTEKSRKK
jgi:DNA repair exonuclease SbcCD ATPase subunit